MRLLILTLLLAMNLQPAAADQCDMHGVRGHAKHAMANHGGHDGCCEADTMPSDRDCDHSAHCGVCTPAVFLSTLRPAQAALPAGTAYRDLATGQLPPGHSAPPFRPPIA